MCAVQPARTGPADDGVLVGTDWLVDEIEEISGAYAAARMLKLQEEEATGEVNNTAGALTGPTVGTLCACTFM